jgi:hypothetical protein
MKTKVMNMRKTDTEMDEILIDCKQGIITQKDIERSIEEYTNSLPDPNVLYINGHKSFNNLLLYIYRHNIKSILPDTYRHDYNLLDDIFNYIYIPLTYRYNRICSINNFCTLVNIDYSLFYDIKNGEYRSTNDNVSLNTSQIIKKWINICNGELLDNFMHTGNVGGIFVAKTRGFTDTPQTAPQITVNLIPNIDAKQLTAIAAELPNTDK